MRKVLLATVRLLRMGALRWAAVAGASVLLALPHPAARGQATSRARIPSAPSRGPEWMCEAAPHAEVAIGSLDPRTGYMHQVELASQGAAVRTVKLSGYFATVEDKRLFLSCGGDEARYQAARRADLARFAGHYSLLNRVGAYRPYATRRVALVVGGTADGAVTIRLDQVHWQHLNAPAVTQPAEGAEARFRTTLHRRADLGSASAAADYRPALRLTKAYRLVKGDYSFEMRLRLENLLERALTLYVDQLGPTGVPKEGGSRQHDGRFVAYGRLDQDGNVIALRVPRTAIMARAEGDYAMPSNLPFPIGRTDEPLPVAWVGCCNRFFGSMAYIRPTSEGTVAAPGAMADFFLLAAPESPTSRTFVTGVRVGGAQEADEEFRHAPAMILRPGGAREIVLDIFAGPKRRAMFADPEFPHAKPLYRKLNYQGTLSLGGCLCTCNVLTVGMMWLLEAIARNVSFGNYGLAVILLALLVRVVLHPLTRQAEIGRFRSQQLQRQGHRLREKPTLRAGHRRLDASHAVRPGAGAGLQ